MVKKSVEYKKRFFFQENELQKKTGVNLLTYHLRA